MRQVMVFMNLLLCQFTLTETSLLIIVYKSRYLWTNPSGISHWVCLHTPLAGHEWLQQCCLLWFVRGSRSQSIQRPRIHHHVFFSHLLQMKGASNFEIEWINSKSKQAKVKLNFYFLVMSVRLSLLHQWMQWIELLTWIITCHTRWATWVVFFQDATPKSTRRNRGAEETLVRGSIVLRAASAP